VLTAQNALIALVMLVGILGIVIPVLPGLLLVWGGSLIWAIEQQSQTGWIVLGVATVAYAAGLAAQYLLPGRRMRAAGIGSWTILIALGVGVVGFFVIPVVGGPIGFIAAVYGIERLRIREADRAWEATKHALRAVMLNIGIELATAVAIMTTWLVGVYLSV
jgi:uncharacterized protein YqgC (DUF456 family)